MPLDNTSPALDALLLGTVLELELSDRDRRVLRKRYDLIKPHLERQGSALAPYLNNALVYAQGSRAIGATIVHGADDDRFDLDGILEFPTPMGWGPAKVLDELYTSLEGFPDSTGIQRCTRCIQLKFAFMHLDLTPMDPASAPRVDRVGDIYTVRTRARTCGSQPIPTVSHPGSGAGSRSRRSSSATRSRRPGRRSASVTGSRSAP